MELMPLDERKRLTASQFTHRYYDAKLDDEHLRLKAIAKLQNPLKNEPLLKEFRDAHSAPPPVTPHAWRDSHEVKLQRARTATSHSQRLREENKRLCNETRHLTDIHKHEVQQRINERFCDIKFWRQELDEAFSTLADDTETLRCTKNRLQKQFDALQFPLETSEQCTNIRSKRIGVEDVEDEVQAALRQEAEEMSSSRDIIKKILNRCLNQTRCNLSCLYYLKKNLEGKEEALQVEDISKEITPIHETTSIIFYQKIDPSEITVEDWKTFCTDLISRAEREHRKSMEVNSTAEIILSSTTRQCQEKFQQTNEFLDRRISDTRSAKGKLEGEHAEVVQEQSNLELSISEIRAEIEAKKEPLAVAQTRVKTRLLRPPKENTSDEVEKTLLGELNELECSLQRLFLAYKTSVAQLQNLNEMKTCLENDINLKSKTLLLDEVEIKLARSKVLIDFH